MINTLQHILERINIVNLELDYLKVKVSSIPSFYSYFEKKTIFFLSIAVQRAFQVKWAPLAPMFAFRVITSGKWASARPSAALSTDKKRGRKKE